MLTRGEHDKSACPKQQVAMADRPFFECGQTGHSSRNCPKKKRIISTVDHGPQCHAGGFNGFFIVDDDGF